MTARAAVGAADQRGLKTRALEVSEVTQFEGAFRTARDDRAQALLVLPSPFFNAHRRDLIKLAASYRLPAFYEFKEYVQDGGLISYGPSLPDMWRRAASYVDRILKGAKPGDLPIERPTKFELIINLKTAKALGLTIPPAVLARADEVISDPAHLARRPGPPATSAGLLDVRARSRADALPRRRSSPPRLDAAPDAPDPRLVRLFDRVPAGASGGRLVVARADLGADADAQPTAPLATSRPVLGG